MNKLSKNTLIIICALTYIMVNIPSAHGQIKNPNPCLSSVKEIYKKLNHPPSSAHSQTYFLDYEVKTILNNGKASPYTSRIKVYINKDQTRMESKEMNVFEDKNNSFTVLDDRKMIFRGQSSKDIKKESMAKNAMLLQDTLFDLVEKSDCREINPYSGLNADKQITLVLTNEGQKLFAMKTITFYISSKRHQIHRIHINYLEKYKIVSSDIVFNEINYNYKGNLSQMPVASLFLNAHQELLPQYKGYKLIDQRKKG